MLLTAVRRASKLLKMSPGDRRRALRRKRDAAVGDVVFGRLGTRLNLANHLVYLSYVPDSIREHGHFPDLRSIGRTWTDNNTHNNGGDLPRLLFLIQNAAQILGEGVPGDFAELGVHRGHSAAILADMLGRPSGRRLHLFDTFAGFDERDLRGIDSAVPRMFEDTSLHAAHQRVGHDELCSYYPGHFPGSTTGFDPDVRFALVHLDCDLYEPMSAALHFFYPRTTLGGLIIMHDYSSGHWGGVAAATDEFLADKPERVVLIPDKSGTAVFRRVH